MTHRLLPVSLFLVAAGIAAAGPARAEDTGSWLRSLRQPDTGLSCCDISDCRQTEADWHSGQWWAKVDGQMTPIPKQKELQKSSADGEAYVCAGQQRKIYCFIPPNMSM